VFLFYVTIGSILILLDRSNQLFSATRNWSLYGGRPV